MVGRELRTESQTMFIQEPGRRKVNQKTRIKWGNWYYRDRRRVSERKKDQ